MPWQNLCDGRRRSVNATRVMRMFGKYFEWVVRVRGEEYSAPYNGNVRNDRWTVEIIGNVEILRILEKLPLSSVPRFPFLVGSRRRWFPSADRHDNDWTTVLQTV